MWSKYKFHILSLHQDVCKAVQTVFEHITSKAYISCGVLWDWASAITCRGCRWFAIIKMEITILLEYSDRSQLRAWLQENHSQEKECWVVMSRSKTPPSGILPYIDVVEEALCFGWIDSTLKKLPDGRLVQRLSPRRKSSHWTELNKKRCQELESRGLMAQAGRDALENNGYNQ